MTDSLPLNYLSRWEPFQIDALGLVTMIGADQVNAAVGRLVRSRFTEYLPVLGAFVFASDQFTRSVPGFLIYNINEGITTSDVAGWFARYLQARKMTNSVTTLKCTSCDRRPPIAWWNMFLAGFLSFVANAVLFVLAVFEADWFGFVNAFSMLVSIVVRAHLVWQNRKAIDQAAESAKAKNSPEVRVVCLLPDGKLLTILAPTAVLRQCFIKQPEPPKPKLYLVVRMIGWLFFGVHVITIGSSSLAVQLVSVIILCGSTILVACQVGDQEDRIGNRLFLERDHMEPQKLAAFPSLDRGHGDRRQNAYVFLEPIAEELESMEMWGLVPHKKNRSWWQEYDEKVRLWQRDKHKATSRNHTAHTWESQATTIQIHDLEKAAASSS